MHHYIKKKTIKKNLNNLSNFSESPINNVWMNWTIYKDENTKFKEVDRVIDYDHFISILKEETDYLKIRVEH